MKITASISCCTYLHGLSLHKFSKSATVTNYTLLDAVMCSGDTLLYEKRAPGQLECGWKDVGQKLSSDIFLTTNPVDFNTLRTGDADLRF